MVNSELRLDNLFGALADPTRRSILHRLLAGELTVGQIAEHYSMSVPAVSKHLKVLERASLIVKRKSGKERIVSIQPAALREINEYLSRYEALYTERLDRLEIMLEEK